MRFGKHQWRLQGRILWTVVGGVAIAGAVLLSCLIFLPPIKHPSGYAPADMASGPQEAPAEVAGFRTITWSQLVPPDWSPPRPPTDLDVSALKDNDPRALELLAKIREAWSTAPANPAMEGQPVNLAGYVVPLERSSEGLLSFLLVPQLGACIHTPPPPANQIVYVELPVAMPNIRSMDAVWVRGALQITTVHSDAGTSSYKVVPRSVEKYEQSWRWN